MSGGGWGQSKQIIPIRDKGSERRIEGCIINRCKFVGSSPTRVIIDDPLRVEETSELVRSELLVGVDYVVLKAVSLLCFEGASLESQLQRVSDHWTKV